MAERLKRPLSPCITVLLDENRKKINEENPGGEEREAKAAKQKDEYTKAGKGFVANGGVNAVRSRSITAGRSKRPLSAFRLWFVENHEKIKEEFSGEMVKRGDINKRAGELWRAMKDKSEWQAKAAKQNYEYTKAAKEFKANGRVNTERSIMGEIPRRPLSPCITVGLDENLEEIKEDHPGREVTEIDNIDRELWRALKDKFVGREAKAAQQKYEYLKVKLIAAKQKYEYAKAKAKVVEKKYKYIKAVEEFKANGGFSEISIIDENREELKKGNLSSGEVTETDKRNGELWRPMKDKSETEAKQKDEYTKVVTEFQDNCSVNAERSIMAKWPKPPFSAYFLWLNENREKIKKEISGKKLNRGDFNKRAGKIWRGMNNKSEWEEKLDKQRNEYAKAKALKGFEANGPANTGLRP